jgi:hypothetical protein
MSVCYLLTVMCYHSSDAGSFFLASWHVFISQKYLNTSSSEVTQNHLRPRRGNMFFNKYAITSELDVLITVSEI